MFHCSLEIVASTNATVFFPQSHAFVNERNQGLHVIVWNEDGSPADYSVFQKFTDLREFIDSKISLNPKSVNVFIVTVFTVTSVLIICPRLSLSLLGFVSLSSFKTNNYLGNYGLDFDEIW